MVLLPPEDLEVATDPRVYRIVVEALLGRLRAGGVREVALAPPCFYGRPKRQQQRLWDEVREAAKLSEATALDVSDWLDESRWRVDPEQEGVYGRAPNALGLKKIGAKAGRAVTMTIRSRHAGRRFPAPTGGEERR
ncbi:MAG: hypothetical protein M5U26_02160 [Planctomycetota bacterium]|nr:hypothetical protein [Planctomycetota bacterium]